MTNHDIIKIVNFVLNKDINGNAFGAAEFTSMINAQSLRLFYDKMGLTQEYQLNAPVARSGVGLSKKLTQDLLPFYKTTTKAVVGGMVSLAGLSSEFVITVIPVPIIARGFDDVNADELGNRLSNPITAPSLSDPIMVWTASNTFMVYPATITRVTVHYYEEPAAALVTFTTDPVTLLPVYSGTELAWSNSNKVEIAYRILRDAGVNIERSDVMQYANQIVQSGK
jgi:hypothetical protein